ncbi:MAG: inositol monophosphatase [Holosporaceae bacterium]|nr:MAG: inositol monophosphatase [Holosporaceae bacterium]
MYRNRTLTNSAHLNVMIEAAEKAGRSLIRDFNEIEKLQIAKKGPADFVSVADKRSEKIVYDLLKKGRPDYSFLMEESGAEENKDKENVWIIDPLDGTTNFLHGLPGFCVTIAHQSKGRIEHAVTYDPLRGDVFWAERGKGAFLNGDQLRVSSRQGLTDAVLLTSHHDPEKKRTAFFNSVWKMAHEKVSIIRCLGSAALDLAYVAAGKAEAYFMYGLQPWDVAAGILLIQEAGGMVSEIDGKSHPETGNSILASNAALYDDLRKELSSC